MKKQNCGISLIVLVITIIVIIILASAIIISVGYNNPIDKSKNASFKNDLIAIQENLKLYINKKYNETNGEFNKDSLFADKDSILYNLIEDYPLSEEENFLSIIGKEYQAYQDDILIESGKIVYQGPDINNRRQAEDLGIKTAGVLIDSNGVLMCVYDISSLIDGDGVLRIPARVKEISEGAFNGLSLNIKRVVIPGTCKIIRKNAFSAQSSIEEIQLEEGVEMIENSAFAGCQGLVSITFPDTIVNMGTMVLASCRNLQEVIYSKGMIDIPGTFFYYCINLKKVTNLENVQVINGSAFLGCSKLESLSFSNKLCEIGADVFTNCDSLNLSIAEDNQTYKMDGTTLCSKDGKKILQIFKASNLVQYNVPEGLEDLGTALSNCKNLESLHISSTLTKVNTPSLAKLKKLNKIEVDSSNEFFSADENALYNKDGTALILFFSQENTSYTIKDGVKVLKTYSFGYKTNLVNVTFPDSLNTIESHTFNGCRNITSFSLGANIKSLTGLSFYGVSTYDITIDPNNENYIIEDNMLFTKSKKTLLDVFENREKVVIPEGVQIIESYAFHSNNKLTEVTIPDTVTTINISFNYCYALKKLEIPSSVKTIHKLCFDNSSINEIIIDNYTDSITGAPWGCKLGVKSVTWLKGDKTA